MLDLFLIELKTKEFIDENDFYILGDYIIGEFLGGSDLLLLRLDKDKEDYGSILVVNQITDRDDWYKVEKSFMGLLRII